MSWRIIEECRDQQKPEFGKFTDVVNMDMVCRVTWDEAKGKRIAHLANGYMFELKNGTAEMDDFKKILNLMP